MKLTKAQRLIDQIEGAVIVCGRVDEGEGLTLDFSNGTSLVIVGNFAWELVRFGKDMRH